MDDDHNREKNPEDIDLLMHVSSKEILQKAATRQSVYKIIDRVSEKLKREFNRHLNREERHIIYDTIRRYRKSHNLTVEYGIPRQREDQSMYK